MSLGTLEKVVAGMIVGGFTVFGAAAIAYAMKLLIATSLDFLILLAAAGAMVFAFGLGLAKLVSLVVRNG